MTAEELGQLIAAGRGTAEVSAYLAAGGDVNATEPRSGMPLLHLACEHQYLDAIRALVGAGADINARDGFGQASLHLAVDSDIKSVTPADGPVLRFETTCLLLSLGADPNVRDN
jgi:ankyrin repeat protein